MLKGIFIDLNVLINIENKAWVVDKKNSNTPILKISKSELNLIKSGIYKNQGNKIDFNGTTFYLPTNLMNKIKLKVKSYNLDFSNLGISLQEFMNKDIIDNLDYELNLEFISNLKNKIQDIYIICSDKTRKSYESLLEKLEMEFQKNGLIIKNYYPISENFLNQNDDDIRFKKMRLLIQHLVGYRTDGNKFKDEEITRYDQIEFYDNSNETLKMSKEINNLFEFLLSRTDDGLRSVIKEDVVEYKPSLMIFQENENKVNQRNSSKVFLNISKIVKTFENFNPYSS
jgi:hypothetical protein